MRKNLTPRTATDEHEKLILELRRKQNFGPKGMQHELKPLHGFTFSSSTIWHVLHRNKVSVLKPGKRPRKTKRYNRPVPGDRVQIDTCKIGKGLTQFTAVDDCTRLRVLGLHDAKTAKNSIALQEKRLLKEFPFPIQRIQTDRGCEFVAFEFQDALY